MSNPQVRGTTSQQDSIDLAPTSVQDRVKRRKTRHEFNPQARGSSDEYNDRHGNVSHRGIAQRRSEVRQRGGYNKQRQLQWDKFMHSDAKNHMVAVLGEFLGTTTFLFFAFAGAQNGSIGEAAPDSQSLIYVSLSFGLSLLINAWIFYRISGGLFNPAVTIALMLTKAITPVRAVLIFIAELCGSCFAAYLVKVLFPVPLSVQTKLSAGTTEAQGLFIEAICTAELVFTILMLAAEKHKATFIAPIGIGLALFVSELGAVYYTGGSLNPARSFGPAAVARDFPSHHWIYWLGPVMGSLFATFFYWLFKVLEYEMANPGQDGDEENDPTQNPKHEVAQTEKDRDLELKESRGIEQDENAHNSSEGSRTPPNGQLKDDEISHTSHRRSTQEEYPSQDPTSRAPNQRRRISRESNTNTGRHHSQRSRQSDKSSEGHGQYSSDNRSGDPYINAVRRERLRRRSEDQANGYQKPLRSTEPDHNIHVGPDRRKRRSVEPDLEAQIPPQDEGGWYTVRQ